MIRSILAVLLLAGSAYAQPYPSPAPSFAHVIRKAYLEILQREADAGGLAVYQNAMAAGLSEAGLRESLLHSVEYAAKFPGPQPSPSPTPAPSGLLPLRVFGTKFLDFGGTEVKPLEFVNCCDDPNSPGDEAVQRGWPSRIDDATLDRLVVAGVNFVHVRLGPFKVRTAGVDDSGETPENVAYADAGGGKVDLNRWNETFWGNLDAFLGKAHARGIRVEIDIADFWVQDHRLSPWCGEWNVNGVDACGLNIGRNPPQAVHVNWIREVARRTRHHPHVIYQDGNESWKGAHPPWIHGMRDVLRQETASDPTDLRYRLFSTNGGRSLEVDYLTTHQRTAANPGALPLMVNEYPTQTVAHVLTNAKTAWDNGTTFAYWRGEHSLAQQEEVFNGLRVIRDGGNPVSFPDSCPELMKMGVQIHNMVDRHFQPTPRPVIDGHVVLDLTPKFGNPPRPCNRETDQRCGGRPCEPPNGGFWQVIEAPSGTRVTVQTDGFQLKIGPLKQGFHRIRVSPHPDSRDALGVPHRIGPHAVQEITFTVEP